MDNRGRRRAFVRKPRREGRGRENGFLDRSLDLLRRPLEIVRGVLREGDGAASRSKDEALVRGEKERARIVVPRQERGEQRRSPLDLELREVRTGSRPGDRYLRYVPSQRPFVTRGRGYIEATRVGSRPRGVREKVLATVKSIALGNPFATSQLIHERLSRIKALAILGSDPLSSSAYATEEALIILALAGAAGLGYLIPIGVTVAVLLVIVTISYQQTIKAYPGGGGAYSVAHDNLGRAPGLIAAGALIVDYTLLVSVSTAAGVAAITSAVPELHDVRVPMSVAVIGFFTLGNLRGVRESGSIFAAPTYFFILMMCLTVLVGFIKVLIGDAPGSLTEAGPPQDPERLDELATGGVTLWLVLRAFSSGASALTGVEAIANGVPSFKKPESDNARATMVMMAAVAVFLFLGITFLSSRFGLVPSHDETLVSLLGRNALGDNVLYYAYQAATALILFLAANTSFNAFPLLAAILGRDRYMPRQFSFRGDRLAYSHGIIVLAVMATLLLIVYDASVTKLIPLYAVGVFIAFTLSQAGMVKRWWTRQGPGWRSAILMNGVGLVATGIVAVIIGATKFSHGAWISLLMVAVLVGAFLLIRRHYDWFQRKTAVDESKLPAGVPAATSVESPREHVIVPVDGINKISLGAIGMAREISSMVTAVHLTDDREKAEDFRERWETAVPDVPLLLIESPYRQFVAPMLSYLERLDEQEEQRITVILPTFVPRHWWEHFLHNRDVVRLRPFLKDRPGLRVVDFPYRLYENGRGGQGGP